MAKFLCLIAKEYPAFNCCNIWAQANPFLLFLDVAEAMSTLRPTTLLLDGEVSVFDREGVSRFQLLQNLGAGKSVFAVFRRGRSHEHASTHHAFARWRSFCV